MRGREGYDERKVHMEHGQYEKVISSMKKNGSKNADQLESEPIEQVLF